MTEMEVATPMHPDAEHVTFMHIQCKTERTEAFSEQRTWRDEWAELT